MPRPEGPPPSVVIPIGDGSPEGILNNSGNFVSHGELISEPHTPLRTPHEDGKLPPLEAGPNNIKPEFGDSVITHGIKQTLEGIYNEHAETPEEGLAALALSKINRRATTTTPHNQEHPIAEQIASVGVFTAEDGSYHGPAIVLPRAVYTAASYAVNGIGSERDDTFRRGGDTRNLDGQLKAAKEGIREMGTDVFIAHISALMVAKAAHDTGETKTPALSSNEPLAKVAGLEDRQHIEARPDLRVAPRPSDEPRPLSEKEVRKSEEQTLTREQTLRAADGGEVSTRRLYALPDLPPSATPLNPAEHHDEPKAAPKLRAVSN